MLTQNQVVPSKIYGWRDGIYCPACGWQGNIAANFKYYANERFLPARVGKLCDRCEFMWFEETVEARAKRIRYLAGATASIFLAFVGISCILCGLAVI